MKKLIDSIKNFFIGLIWRKRILYVAIGAFGGYAYYYFIGCVSGACPISSNPYISTVYGASIGFLLTIGGSKKE
jgi:hypothetical protein